jgi:LysR family transcriptional activator of nhaA
MRRSGLSLDEWLQASDLRPMVAGEFEDSALLMAFSQRGAGIFPAPSPIAREVERQYRVVEVGTVPGVRERLYAVSVERRIRHPAVAAIFDAARAIMDERKADHPKKAARRPSGRSFHSRG